MPRIWTDTIETHRQQVIDAILDATAELIADHGPMSVAMSAIADRAAIGRATLYKYFPDVQSILVAWHKRDFSTHLQRLRQLTEAERVTLKDVTVFVQAQRRHHPHRNGADVVGALAHLVASEVSPVDDAVEREILTALTDLLTRLRRAREVRSDYKPELLARWLLHTIHAPRGLDDNAIAQLVTDSLAPRSGR